MKKFLAFSLLCLFVVPALASDVVTVEDLQRQKIVFVGTPTKQLSYDMLEITVNRVLKTPKELNLVSGQPARALFFCKDCKELAQLLMQVAGQKMLFAGNGFSQMEGGLASIQLIPYWILVPNDSYIAEVEKRIQYNARPEKRK